MKLAPPPTIETAKLNVTIDKGTYDDLQRYLDMMKKASPTAKVSLNYIVASVLGKFMAADSDFQAAKRRAKSNADFGSPGPAKTGTQIDVSLSADNSGVNFDAAPGQI